MKEGRRGGFKLWYAFSLALQLGFLIVVPLGGLMALGWWGDTKLDTSPLFLLLGALVGSIVAAYETYHALAPLLRELDKEDTAGDNDVV